MIIDLQSVLDRLSPENRTALFDRAEREGLTVGQLVKRWIGERLSVTENWKAAA